jgi:dipeptidyl aminopeptidase/acylaminoacyl peptidase
MLNGSLAVLVGALLMLATTAVAGPQLEDFGKLPAVEQMSLSPDGKNVVFATTVGDKRRVIVQSTTNDSVALAIDAGSAKLRDLKWLGVNHVAITTSVTKRRFSDKVESAFTSVYNINTKHGLIVFGIWDDKAAKITFGNYGYSRSGNDEYGYFGGIGTPSFVQNRYIDLFRVNLDNGEDDDIASGYERAQTHWVLSPEGEIVAESIYHEATGDWRLYGHPAVNHLLEASHSPLNEIHLLGLGRSPKTVVVERPADDGGWSYWEYATDKPNQKAKLFEGRDVTAPVWDEHSGVLIGGRGDPNDPWIEFFDPALQAKYDATKRAFKGLRVTPISMIGNLDKLIVKTEGAGDSGTYYFVDIPGHRAQAIAWSYPTVLQADVGEMRIFKYKAADGLEMEGVLTLPPGREAKNLPVVVMPHGGPEAYDTTSFDWWAQAFASRGYAVFQPNYRGSSGHGKTFRDAGLGQWGRKMQTDVSDGLASLAKRGIVDSKRACIVGASYGGYAALAGVTLQQGLYRCAVSYGGVADLQAMLADQSQYGRERAEMRYWREFMGAKSNGDPALAAISPVRLASRADAPILVAYGTDDSVVPPDQSRAMAAALRTAHKSAAVLELKNEDHWLSNSTTRTELVVASVAFVEKYNPPN